MSASIVVNVLTVTEPLPCPAFRGAKGDFIIVLLDQSLRRLPGALAEVWEDPIGAFLENPLTVVECLAFDVPIAKTSIPEA